MYVHLDTFRSYRVVYLYLKKRTKESWGHQHVIFNQVYLSIAHIQRPSTLLFWGAPDPWTAKDESLEQLIKGARRVLQKRTQVRGVAISSRSIQNRESPILSGGSASMINHKSGGQAKRRDRWSEQAEVKVSMCHHAPHVLGDVSKPRDTSNHTFLKHILFIYR